MRRRGASLAVAIVSALVVSACTSVTKMTACHRDGGVRQIRVQSVNAAFLVCGDGRVYRDDNG